MLLKPIPVMAPLRQYQRWQVEIDRAIATTLAHGEYILGRVVRAFEQDFARYLGVTDCVAVASGTDALYLALLAVGVRPGDEVITSAHSAVATTAAIVQVGAKPLFADIEPLSRCLAVDAVAALLNPRVKAVVPVHIYGHPTAMPELMALAQQHGFMVVEDCAQAPGARIADKAVGTWGHAAAFSFYPTKNLGAYGDAGAAVSNDAEVIEQLRLWRQYGWRERYCSVQHGINSRMDTLQAAVLQFKLAHLEALNQRRQDIAQRYCQALAGSHVLPPRVAATATHVYHLFVVESEQRDHLATCLAEAGIATAKHYPLAIHQQLPYRHGQVTPLPRTERLYQNLLSLPMFAELSDEEVDYICEQLIHWVKQTS